MIVRLTEREFYSFESANLEEDTFFLRDKVVDFSVLYHICRRQSTPNGGKIYYCGVVQFDYTLGRYYCDEEKCLTKFEPNLIWKDGEGTGCEGHA